MLLPIAVWMQFYIAGKISLPPHASHMIQPLDKGFFGPLKSAYSQDCDKWMISNPGRVITQRDICSIFRSAYERIATLEEVKNSFKAMGIHPFNPDVSSTRISKASVVTHRPEPEEVAEVRNVNQEKEGTSSSSSSQRDIAVLLQELHPLPIADNKQKRKRKGKKNLRS